MNNNYRHMLISKLYQLRGQYIRKISRTSPTKELKLRQTHVPKVIEFYELNKSKELLDYLLKNSKYNDINMLLTQAEHIARQSSRKRRKIISKICMKGIDYPSLYIISSQQSIEEMKHLINVYTSNDKNKEEILREAKEKILKRHM